MEELRNKNANKEVMPAVNNVPGTIKVRTRHVLIGSDFSQQE